MGESPKTATGAQSGNALRILVVDDDRAGAFLLQQVMTHLRCRYELFFVWDGVEALDFLHCRGSFATASRPNLILLDINMPRLGGLETLSAIKNDPELYVIPVIMFSSSISPEDVRESYRARANCYVQKPSDLDNSVKLVQVIESFWMDFAVLPACDRGFLNSRQAIDSKARNSSLDTSLAGAGYPIAQQSREARSRAMYDSPEKRTAAPGRKSGCEEHNRLLDEFGAAVRELLALHEQQFRAIVNDDSECSRFDLLIHMANEKKQRAKYAYLRHMESHGCSKLDVDETRA
jgi:CheY-like chemotaxis protein